MRLVFIVAIEEGAADALQSVASEVDEGLRSVIFSGIYDHTDRTYPDDDVRVMKLSQER